MKHLKHNNPAVICVLLLVLAVSLGKTFLMLWEGAGVGTPSAPPLAPLTAATDLPPSQIVDTRLEATGRDPFFHPIVLRAALVNEAASGGSTVGGKQGEGKGGKLPMTIGEAGKRSEVNGKDGAGGPGPAGPEKTPLAVSVPELSPLTSTSSGIENHNLHTQTVAAAPDCRLTAILHGRQTTALLLLPDGSNRRVHVGDAVMGAQVASIREREIVIVSASGLWTIPLENRETAETSAADDIPANDISPNLQEKLWMPAVSETTGRLPLSMSTVKHPLLALRHKSLQRTRSAGFAHKARSKRGWTVRKKRQ